MLQKWRWTAFARADGFKRDSRSRPGQGAGEWWTFGLLEDLEPTNAYGNTEWTGQSAMGFEFEYQVRGACRWELDSQ